MTKRTTEFSDIDINTLTGALPVHDSNGDRASSVRPCLGACEFAYVGASACPTQCPRHL